MATDQTSSSPPQGEGLKLHQRHLMKYSYGQPQASAESWVLETGDPAFCRDESHELDLGKEVGDSFAESVFRCKEGAFFNFVRCLWTDPHRRENSGVQIFD